MGLTTDPNDPAPVFYCPNPECGNMAFEPGRCSACGAELEEDLPFSPEGDYVGERLVRKPASPGVPQPGQRGGAE